MLAFSSLSARPEPETNKTSKNHDKITTTKNNTGKYLAGTASMNHETTQGKNNKQKREFQIKTTEKKKKSLNKNDLLQVSSFRRMRLYYSDFISVSAFEQSNITHRGKRVEQSMDNYWFFSHLFYTGFFLQENICFLLWIIIFFRSTVCEKRKLNQSLIFTAKLFNITFDHIEEKKSCRNLIIFDRNQC